MVQQGLKYKVDIHKGSLFLYIDNEQSENEIRKQSHLQQHQKQKKTHRNKFDKGSIRRTHWKLQTLLEGIKRDLGVPG